LPGDAFISEEPSSLTPTSSDTLLSHIPSVPENSAPPHLDLTSGKSLSKSRQKARPKAQPIIGRTSGERDDQFGPVHNDHFRIRRDGWGQSEPIMDSAPSDQIDCHRPDHLEVADEGEAEDGGRGETTDSCAQDEGRKQDVITIELEDPEPMLEEESSQSDDDYAAHREKLEKQRERKRERGKEASDTEAEDLEDEAEMMQGDAGGKEGVRSLRRKEKKAFTAKRKTRKSRSRQMPPRLMAAQKGKSRARVDNEPGVDGDIDEGDGDETLARGPLPHEAISEIQEFGKSTTEQAKALSQKWRKPLRDIMLTAGLGIRNARAKNPANDHRTWFFHKYPKPEGGERFSLLMVQKI
jgi:hypothetical protein